MIQSKLPSNRGETAVAPASHIRQGQPTQTAEIVADRPALALNVQLMGEMQGHGFADSLWLIQRDSRFIQVTELLYRIAEQANGERTLDEIATGVTELTDWMVTAADVRQLIQTKLVPLGLIAPTDGAGASQRGEQARSSL